jgi:hypothetical protein
MAGERTVTGLAGTAHSLGAAHFLKLKRRHELPQQFGDDNLVLAEELGNTRLAKGPNSTLSFTGYSVSDPIDLKLPLAPPAVSAAD